MVERAGIHRLGEFDGVARALDIGYFLARGIGGEIVDRCQVKQVLYLAFELRQLRGRHAELRLRQVAAHRHDTLLLHPPALAQGLEFFLRGSAD